MIQGVGINNVSVDNYRASSVHHRKDGGGAGENALKTPSKKDEAIFSSKGVEDAQKNWSEKTNDEIVKGVQDEHRKLQANIVKSMLVSAGIIGNNGKIDWNSIFDLEIPESEKGLTAEQLIEMLPNAWKPDAVAERIIDFAVSFYEKSGLSGEEFYEKVRAAIDSGFAAADKEIGGKLPGNIKEVIAYTRQAVYERLDKWAEAMGIQIPYTGEDKI